MRVLLKVSKVNREYYFLFFLIAIPILAPYYFLQHVVIGRMLDYMIYFSLLLIAFFCFKNITKITNCIAVIIIPYTFLLLTTIINRGSTMVIIAVIKHSVKVILICFMVECLLYDKKKRDSFLHAVRDVTFIFFIMNLITNIIYKNGIPSITQSVANPYYLFGNVNTTIRMVLPGMCCSSLIDLKRGKKYQSFRLYIYWGLFIHMLEFTPQRQQ